MKSSILLIMDTKKKIRLTILSIIIIVTMTTGMLLTFTYSEKGNIKDNFYKSVNYDPDKDLLSFTIPKPIPKGYKFWLHISGTMFMDNGMSFHAFDEESLSYTWINGKTYTYPLNSDGLKSLALNFGLVDKNTNKLLDSYAIHISPDGTKFIEVKYIMQDECLTGLGNGMYEDKSQELYPYPNEREHCVMWRLTG